MSQFYYEDNIHQNKKKSKDNSQKWKGKEKE